MCSICNKIGQPHFTTEVTVDEAVVWYPEGPVAEDGTMTRNEWVLRRPGPGELERLYDTLIYVGGLEVAKDELTLNISLADLDEFSPRMTELAMLVTDIPSIKRDFADIAFSNKDKFRVVRGSSN